MSGKPVSTVQTFVPWSASSAICVILLSASSIVPLVAQQLIVPLPLKISTTAFTPALFGNVIGVADFNADGRNDILTVYNSSQYAVLFRNSDGTYSPTRGLTGIPFTVAGDTAQVGDVDGDGRADIVLVTSTPRGSGNPPGPSVLSVFLNNGDGTFRAVAPVTVATGFALLDLIMDLNKDGQRDLVIESYSQEFNQNAVHTFTLWANQGGGKFKAQTTINSGTAVFAGLVTAGDFNGDGYPGVVLLSNAATIQVFQNHSGTSFTAGPAFAACAFETCPVVGAAGDLNQDHRAVLVAFGLLPHPERGTILLSNANGSFQTGSTFSITPGIGVITASSATIGDFTGDGLMDIGVAGGGTFQVFPGNGIGGVAFPTAFNTANSVVTIADLRKNGELDLLLWDFNGLSTSQNDGRGNLRAPREDLVARSSAIVSADFNHDGKGDVAAVSDAADLPGSNIANGKGMVVIHTGTGKGFFNPAKKYPIGMASGLILAGDVNGDGKIDLVVTRSASYRYRTIDNSTTDLSVLLGNGDGTFQAPMNFTVLGDPSSLDHDSFGALMDVNHDGKLDLVGDWGVALGKGNGTFSPAIPLPALVSSSPDNIAAMAIGDFNGDGNLDLAVGISFEPPQLEPGYVLTLIGDGKGAFTVSGQQQLPGTIDVLSLAAVDLNNDGKLDLVFSSFQVLNPNLPGTSALTVRLGKGDGTFAPVVNYQVNIGTVSPEPMLVADFNHDGFPDLLIFESDENGGPCGLSICPNMAVLIPGMAGGKLSAFPQVYPSNLTGGALIDLDGDGAPDVVGVSSTGISRILNVR